MSYKLERLRGGAPAPPLLEQESDEAVLARLLAKDARDAALVEKVERERAAEAERVAKLTPDDFLEMVRDEARFASDEGLGHFDENDFTDPTNGETTVTAYGRRWLLKCEALPVDTAALPGQVDHPKVCNYERRWRELRALLFGRHSAQDSDEETRRRLRELLDIPEVTP